MYITNITDDYDDITFTSWSNIENEDLNIIFKYLVLSVPSSILLFSFMVYTLFKNKW